MFDRREKNRKIFEDTMLQYTTDERLKRAVDGSRSKQRFIVGTEAVEKKQPDRMREGRVIVSDKRTLEASEKYAKEGKRVCVLNFASATNPGGGVVHGSSAQEESICRCSTLYPCLNEEDMWEKYYEPHRQAGDPLYNNDCIFTPAVKAFKSDTNFPKLLSEDDWWDVDVITCAAPNLRENPSNRMNPNSGSRKVNIGPEELYRLLNKRIRRIFEIAVAEEAEVLILGAFGCGAFCNPPQIVAKVFEELTKEFRYQFDTVEFAVFHVQREIENYNAFQSAMKDMITG